MSRIITAFIGPILSGLLMFPPPAWGATGGVTLQTEVVPNFRNGALAGCTAAFMVGHEDRRHFGGKLVVISGILGLWRFDNESPVGVLKLSVIVEKDKRVPPVQAFLLDGLETNAADFVEVGPADDPTYALFGYRFGTPTARAFAAAVLTNEISITYAMKDSGFSSTFKVDLTVSDTDLDTAKQTFDRTAGRRLGECITALVKDAEGV